MSKLRKKQMTNAEIITARKNRALDREGYIALILRILTIAFVLWVFLSYVFVITVASGNDMFPAVKDGDVLLGYRLQSDYAKSDVVIYVANGETKVGRIAALGGDAVDFGEDGQFFVNGTAQSGEILYSSYAKDGIDYPYTVPDGSLFILGDYRTQATDSRDFGAVSLSEVKGKLITLLRRRGL